jgi:DNA repair exonuclease SbcCD ATPase subunit
MSAYQKMRDEKNRPPKLGEVLALEVAKFPRETRSDAKIIAECLESVLQAAEKGYKELPNKSKYGPAGMKNPAIIEKQNKMKAERKDKKVRNERIKKRDQQIKDTITKNQVEKKQMLEETKSDRMKQKDDKKKKKDELKKKREAGKIERKKEHDEKKASEQESMQRQQEEDEEKEKRKKDKFNIENKEFLKEQAKKIRKEFKETIKEKNSIQEAEKEYEDLNQKLKETMKKKMEQHFEKNKENFKKDKDEKEALNKFIKNKSVAAVFDAYDTQLRYFFDYYCKSTYHELTGNIDKEFSTVNYKEFIKF